MLMMEFSIVSASKSEGVANPECDYAAPRENRHQFISHSRKKKSVEVEGMEVFQVEKL